jgi:hypothetical protein
MDSKKITPKKNWDLLQRSKNQRVESVHQNTPCSSVWLDLPK